MRAGPHEGAAVKAGRVAVVVRDSAHVVLRYAAALADRTPPGAWASGPGTPVVLIPGIWEPWRYLRPLGARLHALGHPVHPVPALGLNGADLESSADVVAAFLADNGLQGVVAVAHSKGGLIGKRLLLHPRAAPRLTGLVALCTPFGGSRLARRGLARTPLGLFHPTGAILMALAAERTVNARITSIGAAWDQVVPDGSHLDGARNITLSAAGHFRPVADAGVAALVHAEVERLARERACG